MSQVPIQIDRRSVLLGSAVAAVGAATGCRQETEPANLTQPARSDIPLRITLVGQPEDAEKLELGWGAVTEQPLAIRLIPRKRNDAKSIDLAVLDAVASSDVLIYPVTLVAQLSAQEAITEFSTDEIEAIDAESGDLYPAVRSGATRYSGKRLSIPLGAAQPALLSQESIESPGSWAEYDQMVAEQWQGNAAEPAAPGWAAAMFLWRCTAIGNWLFTRQHLEPVIDSEPYVDVLDQMVRTHQRYRVPFQTPDQVWSAVASGELKAGIGFPATGQPDERELVVGDLPFDGELPRILLDAFSPVVSLSANCRQSQAAKRFIAWISGGVGSNVVRDQVPGMTVVRRAEPGGASSDQNVGASDAYRQWLESRLEMPVTVPTLQLLNSGDYYDSLDQQILRALGGEATAQQALSEVSDAWQAMTSKLGVEKQQRTWRRSQGMRA